MSATATVPTLNLPPATRAAKSPTARQSTPGQGGGRAAGPEPASSSSSSSGSAAAANAASSTTTAGASSAAETMLAPHKRKMSFWNSFATLVPKNRHSSKLVDPHRRKYIALDTGQLRAQVHLPLGQFHEGDRVELWSATAAGWVDARVEAEHPVTGYLHVAFNFPTDAKGRERAVAETRAISEKIRLLREEEHFDEQLDATAKGSKDKEIAALLAKAEELQKLLHPRSHAVVDNQDGVEFAEDVRLRLTRAGSVTQLLQRGGVLPHFQLTFDDDAQRTRRTRVAAARGLRSFLLECAGFKAEAAARGRSHREALMTFFAKRDAAKVVEVDDILEYYNTNEDCISRGRTRYLYNKLRLRHGTAPRELLQPDAGSPPDDPDDLVRLARQLQARRQGAAASAHSAAGAVAGSLSLPVMQPGGPDPLVETDGPRGEVSLKRVVKKPAYVAPMEIRRAALRMLGIGADELYAPKTGAQRQPRRSSY